MGRESQIYKKNDGNFTVKGLIVIMILFSFVMIPIYSSADTLPHSDNDRYHGHLEIDAQNKSIKLPLSKESITTEDIVKKVKPSAVQVRTPSKEELRIDVDPSYFISDQDLDKLNSMTVVEEPIIVTLHGQYLYYCSNQGCKRDYSLTGEIKVTVSFTGTVTPPSPPPSYVNFKVTFDGNGGKIDGKNKIEFNLTAEEKNGIEISSSMFPQKVSKEGYKFKGWSTSKKNYTAFDPASKIKKDLTLYASWEKTATDKDDDKVIAVKKDEPVEPPIKKDPTENPTQTRYSMILGEHKTPLDNVANSVETQFGEELSRNPDTPYTKAEFISLAHENNVPVASIGNGDIPLFAPQGAGSWAFANGMLAFIGVFMTLLCLGISFMQRRNKKTIWFVLSIIGGAAGLLFFLVTENLKLNMVLVDQWTAVSAIFFAISAMGLIRHLSQKENIHYDLEEFIYDY